MLILNLIEFGVHFNIISIFITSPSSYRCNLKEHPVKQAASLDQFKFINLSC